MRTYPIGSSSIERIEFKANESQFALIHRLKSSGGDIYKIIILNQLEALSLYYAIEEEILNKREGGV